MNNNYFCFLRAVGGVPAPRFAALPDASFPVSALDLGASAGLFRAYGFSVTLN
jgi:hypothetical protein